MRLEDIVLLEAPYKGNIGMMEMFKFFSHATAEEKNRMKKLLDAKKFDEAWEFLQEVTGMQLEPA